MKLFTIQSAVIGLLCGGTIFTTINQARSHDHSASSGLKGTQRRELQMPVRDFTLTDQRSRKFRFQSLRGKVIVLAFGYTTCPDVCPLITAALRQVQSSLVAAEPGAVHFVMITTDPEIDDPKVLESYAKRYGADFSNWVFLTGSEASLSQVWKNFGVRVLRKSRGLIDHTALTVVIDQTGMTRVAYHGTSPDPKLVLQDIRALLGRR